MFRGMAAPPGTPETTLSGWGRRFVHGSEVFSENLERATQDSVLSRGLGRSYGDSSLPPSDHPIALNTTLADRILSFDSDSGALRAEAGLSLWELNRLFLLSGRNRFVPVSPGTQFVTLGGMVAADVHGKNQHVDGNIGHHILGLRLRVADGRIVECSPTANTELFRATVGGMGLTGHILEVELHMKEIPSPWIYQKAFRAENLDELQDLLEKAAREWPMTYGWIDCMTRGATMGRGIVLAGRWAERSEAPLDLPKRRRGPRLPFTLPSWALNRFTLRLMNELIYRKQWTKESEGLVHPETFFYPLDMIQDWNRMYGSRGLTQWQGLIPRAAGKDSARRILDLLTRRGGASFLAVLKDCDMEGVGMLSFPGKGITLALDIPVRGDTQALIDELNEALLREGGRIYLAKDSFTRPEHFQKMEPRLAEFERVRDQWDPERRIRSAQSVRLFGDPPTAQRSRS